MSERLGFALVILVAIASVASLLFMSGAEPTGNIIYGQPGRGINADLCTNVLCMDRSTSEPMLDAKGYPMFRDDGTLICICPFG
jgi:hypothetical protein